MNIDGHDVGPWAIFLFATLLLVVSITRGRLSGFGVDIPSMSHRGVRLVVALLGIALMIFSGILIVRQEENGSAKIETRLLKSSNASDAASRGCDINTQGDGSPAFCGSNVTGNLTITNGGRP